MKILTFLFLTASLFATAILFAACADPAANKPKAQVADEPKKMDPAKDDKPAPATDTSANVLENFQAKGSALEITPATSKVEFTGSKVTGKHDGGFKDFKGVIDLVGDKAETSKVLFEIEMKSVFTDTDGVTKHLQTPDFFDVEKYPKASFVSTEIKPAAAGGDSFDIKGDMTIHGVKKSITFPATIKITADSVAVNAEFSINRKDFQIMYAGKADDLIRDDVVLRLDLKAAKKK